jgi:hypothetical protein
MNVPPGSMKSLLTGVFFPAWEWGPRGMPAMRYLGTAHKEPLAVRDSVKCRRLIQSRWFQDRWPLAADRRSERQDALRECRDRLPSRGGFHIADRRSRRPRDHRRSAQRR